MTMKNWGVLDQACRSPSVQCENEKLTSTDSIESARNKEKSLNPLYLRNYDIQQITFVDNDMICL